MVRNDKLVHTPFRKRESDYMATPEVTIVGKKEVVAGADGGRASFAFKLNTMPDMWWRYRFATNLEDPPKGVHRSAIRVDIQDDTLLLICMPTRLDAKYAFIKATIAKTNSDHPNPAEPEPRARGDFGR